MLGESDPDQSRANNPSDSRLTGTINSLLLLMWRVSRLYDTHFDTCQSKTRASDPVSIGKVSLAKVRSRHAHADIDT